MDLPAGLTGSAALTVTATDTAEALGSGDVPVLATPRVVALVEAATVDAVRGRLPAGQTTVGVRVDLSHQAPSPIGAVVTADARLLTVGGRSIRFAVTVTDQNGGLVAEATVDRVAVDRIQFLAGLPGVGPAE